MSAPSATPINFADYTLKANENVLTATPRKGGGPAVTVDLNGVIGNDSGRLKFGGKDFAKASKSIMIVEKAGSNWLQADCLTKQGTYNKSELKLDGSLQITIPTKHHAKDASTGCCDTCAIM